LAIGCFAHFAPAIRLGLRLVLITPHLELGDHLRHRQMVGPR
jgi:hypothetical protein